MIADEIGCVVLDNFAIYRDTKGVTELAVYAKLISFALMLSICQRVCAISPPTGTRCVSYRFNFALSLH